MTPTTPLDSSLLTAMRYSAQATLDLVFRDGVTYRYFTVPRPVAEGLASAASKGAYFNRHIKGCFPVQRLT